MAKKDHALSDGACNLRQGQILSHKSAVIAGLLTLDEQDKLVVVISHDCDIARLQEIEPYVEVIIGKKVNQAAGDLTHGKNPRKIHIAYQLGDELSFVECNTFFQASFASLMQGTFSILCCLTNFLSEIDGWEVSFK